MRTNHSPNLALRASVIAVQGALAVLATMGIAQAADATDPAVLELVQPANRAEIGVIYTDKDSFKFGEYNGLQREGLHPNASFDVRGGGAYDGASGSGSVERWRIYGRDLGLAVRSLGAEYAHQGEYRVTFDYDELRRNYSDTYQTLWNGGGMGLLTLPAGYPSITTRAGSPALANWNNIQAPNVNAATTGGGPGVVIPGLMRGFDVYTTRRKLAFGGEVSLSPQWTASLNARTEHKDGTKLTGAAMAGFKGALVPEPIDSDTTIVDADLRWVDKQGHFSIGYSSSFYRNHVDGYFIEYPFAWPGTIGNQVEMNGAPDNQMHQLHADGSWRFSPTMKLVMAGSYTRMTQNEAFHYQSTPAWNVNGGATSSNSKEIQTNFLARLVAKPMPALDLTAAYKLDHRDNRSPVGSYAITQYDGLAAPTASTTFSNVPLNRKQQTLSLDARYALAAKQSVTAGLEHVIIERTADASINPLSHEINNPFASAKAVENTFKLGYRQAFSDMISGQVSYQHSRRRAEDYEEAEVNPPGSGSNVGFFSEVPGFRQFFLNDRNRDKFRAAADFQVTEQLFVQAGVDYIQDRFPGGEFGLKKTGTTAFNLDGSYAVNDKLSFSGYVTYEDAKSKQEQFQIPVARTAAAPVIIPHTPDGTCASYSNATGLPADYLTDPCRMWSVTQGDRIWTFGLGAKSSQFMGGKLTLTGDVLYSLAKTNLNFTGGTYYSNGVSLNTYFLAANVPEILSRVTELRLGAKYAYSKQSAVNVGLLHRRLRSTDPQFDLFGITSVQAYIGPGITAPKYNVNAVSVSYVYTFR